MTQSSLRTPLAKVRGLGAARAGTTHFIAQRVSAIALAALAPWFVISAATALDGSYESARAWLAQPAAAVPMLLFALAAFYHMGAGMQVIVEDYIHKPASKITLLLANLFVWAGLGTASVFAILKISLGS